jgi:hypothetical protein
MVRKTILVAVALFAAVPAVAQQGEWQGPFTVTAKWGPFLDVEGMVGNKRSIGELDLFVPLGQSERTLLFADARFKADNQESLEGNFGLGLRHMLAGGWNAGAYGYFDRRRTPTFNSYNQLTFGGEMLGTNFDLRGNTYWPIGQTSNVVSSSAGGPATAAVSGTSLLVTFPGMSTSTEYAMAGFDAEAGVRVPIFDTTGPYDLRFYAGGYRFSDGITPVVAGPRLRLEFTNYRIPELWGGTRLMTGVEYQYDDVRGSQVFASLRLRVPLQAEPRRGTLTYQERRMTDPIVRDIDIVAQVQTVTAPSVTEAATATAAGNTLAVVNAASTSGANLQAAVTGAGANSTIVLSGTFNTTTTTTLQAGQTVVGSAPIAVRTASGRNATVTPSGGATIASTVGGSTNPAVAMASNSTLAGMTISRTAGGGLVNPVGVHADGVSGVTISGNTITTTSTGAGTAFGVRILNGASGSVTNNTITATNTSTGIAIAAQVAGGGASATVSGNTLSGTGTPGRTVDLVGPVSVSGTGNVAASGTCTTSGAITGSIGFTNGTTCP